MGLCSLNVHVTYFYVRYNRTQRVRPRTEAADHLGGEASEQFVKNTRPEPQGGRKGAVPFALQQLGWALGSQLACPETPLLLSRIPRMLVLPIRYLSPLSWSGNLPHPFWRTGRKECGFSLQKLKLPGACLCSLLTARTWAWDRCSTCPLSLARC